ncbi:hypothetical protein, partial [Variovorax sp. UMC13]|uniref:hypothetical protein n=1 Tax=Variovorax sp. UMC13 TaxID=1862326 RepID=UPI001600F872
GGGGGEDAIQVTFNPSSLSGSYVLNDPNSSGPGVVLVKARLSSTPAGTLYPVIADPKSFLTNVPGVQIATRDPDGAYSMLLLPRLPASAGVVEGELTLHLCKDSACASEYKLAGATLPYRYVYDEALSVTLNVNGVPATGINNIKAATSGKTFQTNVASGDVLELNSSIPVTWSAYPMGSTNATINPISSTSKNWKASVTNNTYTGYVSIKATPIDTRQYEASFIIEVQ